MTPPLLLHVFPRFEVGGAQVRFITVANHLGARFRHAVVSMDGDLSARTRFDPALDVSFPTVTLRRGDLPGNVRAIRRLLRTLRPARLVTSNWGSIEWAVANRTGLVPHLHVEDGFGPDERQRQLPRRVWMRRVFLAGRTVVVPSLTLRRIAVEAWRLDPARVRYVPNGIDLRRFDRAEAPVAAGGPVIGTVAVMRAEKNVGRLVRAFARLPPAMGARLLLVGDGPERPALEALAAELGVAARVQWAGFQADPVPFLHSMDVFALSSDTEQMPISLLEAMAARLPCACTDVGDVASILPPAQRGLVVPSDDAALAGALSVLAAGPALRHALGEANRARVAEQFDQRRMFAEWERLYLGQQESRPAGSAPPATTAPAR